MREYSIRLAYLRPVAITRILSYNYTHEKMTMPDQCHAALRPSYERSYVADAVFINRRFQSVSLIISMVTSKNLYGPPSQIYLPHLLLSRTMI